MERIDVRAGDRPYMIEVEAGSLDRLGTFAAASTGVKPGAAALVTTETVAGLYLDRARESLEGAGYKVTTVVIPDGEEQKTVATWEGILTRLIEARFERKSLVVPLGGGVVGDIAGFAAASLLRGVPFIQVPTTIVAQVDSSIGGKVAVDHTLGKNLIGSFYQPRGVLIDTRLLTTLAPREVVSGMGEVVKHAVIRDEAFFTFLEEHMDSLMRFDAPDGTMEEFIAWNCRIKADVVSQDEREQGLRAILNYGHTIGHALETVTDYTYYSHGEAVILGMVAAAAIAVRKGLIDEAEESRQNRLLEQVGINRGFTDIDADAMIEAMGRDKKVSGGTIRFVLPTRIGAVEVFDDVTEDDIRHGIAKLREIVGGA